MNISDLILTKGEDAAPAVLSKEGVTTYGELRTQVAHIAQTLLGQGCTKGDRVGVFSENSPFFIASYLGVIRAGLTAVPFQTDLPIKTFNEITASADIRKILVSTRFTKQMEAWVKDAGLTLLRQADCGKPAEVNATAIPKIDPSCDLAALMFTSGSTGAPKGVMVSHRNIECNTHDIIDYMGLTSADRVMIVLPLHYCFGMSLLHTHLTTGASVVLNNSFKLFPEMVLQELQQRECTGFAGVPSTYQILLRKSRFREMQFPKLRWFQQAGGKLPDAQIAEILFSFPQIRYFLMYGQTEATARLSYLPPDKLGDKLGSIGRGLPSTRLAVLRQDETGVTAGSNEVGEIVASGDNITLGYWKDPMETAKYFKNGRLHTGDLARVDDEGFIFIVERERDMIKSGGNRVSAKEVEDVIAEVKQVVEVAVLGSPHELLGECIKAFVVSVPGGTLTPSELREHCRKRLPSFKVPEEIIFLRSMPHNNSGKILKPKLVEMLTVRQPVESVQSVGPLSNE